MQQVLFRIPDPTGNFPDGFPIHGYGVMLFITFMVCIWFARRHSARAGIPKDRLWDLALWVFMWGIVGGRLVYVLQYRVPFTKFLFIWEGGLVIYGALIAGFISYWVFYLLFLKGIHFSSWRLADVAAPTIALGMALGRIGCLLNGCCYGHVASEGCPALQFPLLPAPAREALVENHGYQTAVGFGSAPRDPDGADIRTIVSKLEPGSPAEQSGLQPGDRIVAFNGQRNGGSLWLRDSDAFIRPVAQLAKDFESKGFRIVGTEEAPGRRQTLKVYAPFGDPKDFADFRQRALKLAPGADYSVIDIFSDQVMNWPRGRNELHLIVDRNGQEVDIPAFVPRTLGLHPTQLYETISMSLLLFLLLAYYPFRRHNGQVFVLLMVGYAIHRFLNEILRNDTPVEWYQMTLSQNISVLILAAALVLELWLRWTQPKRLERGVEEPTPEPEPVAEAQPAR